MSTKDLNVANRPDRYKPVKIPVTEIRLNYFNATVVLIYMSKLYYYIRIEIY